MTTLTPEAIATMIQTAVTSAISAQATQTQTLSPHEIAIRKFQNDHVKQPGTALQLAKRDLKRFHYLNRDSTAENKDSYDRMAQKLINDIDAFITMRKADMASAKPSTDNHPTIEATPLAQVPAVKKILPFNNTQWEELIKQSVDSQGTVASS
jgi:hypothetical protein